MENPFLFPVETRLRNWRQLRQSLLTTEHDSQKLTDVAKYWGQAPLINTAYDCNDPHSWLSPWEMIGRGNWCRNSVAIGIEVTLRLGGFDGSRLLLGTITIDNGSMMIVKVDDDWILNYNWGLLSHSFPDMQWITKFRWSHNKYEKI